MQMVEKRRARPPGTWLASDAVMDLMQRNESEMPQPYAFQLRWPKAKRVQSYKG